MLSVDEITRNGELKVDKNHSMRYKNRFFRVWKKQKDPNIIDKDYAILCFIPDSGLQLNMEKKGHECTVLLFEFALICLNEIGLDRIGLG